MKYILLSITLIIGINLSAQKSLRKKLKELDEYYEQAYKDWKVPGIAVAIVKDGEIIFAKGYGIRNLDTMEEVDENTLFAIASNSKAFTAAGLAILVDEGKISWKDKVRKYLPWFELYSPYVSENFTIEDLLTHRSGLKTFSGDLLWYGTDHSREEIVRRAKHLEPAYGFRDAYGYSNIMYLTAGLIIEEVSGMSWDDFITKNILEPLHMDRTLTSTNELSMMENFCAPHNDFQDSLITIEWLNWDNIAPAGALISSVNDISKWLIFQLNQGITPDGDTLIQKRRFQEMWAPHILQNVSSWSQRTWPSTHFKAYGYGFAMFDYLGKKVLGHGGGYDGFITNTTFVPEENLGFTILTNKNTSLYYPLKYKTLDVLLDADEETDWSGDFLALFAAKNAKEDSIPPPSNPTLDEEVYLGTYTCEMYGDAKVYKEDGKMMLHLLPTEIFVGELIHYQHNTWELEFAKVPSLPKGKVNFTIDIDGNIDEMQVDVPNPDFDFTELKFKKVK
ncbi:serine hydrolase [Bacteroidota bacterium]